MGRKKTNKEEMIGFNIEADAKIAFEKHCRENYTSMSQKLYAFVHQTIKHSGKKIDLTEYRERKKN